MVVRIVTCAETPFRMSAMSNPMNDALRRQSKLAFRRMRPGAELIKRFHLLHDDLRKDKSLQKLSAWLVVPFSLWPVDIIGLAEHLIALAEQGKRPASEFQALIALLGNPPTEETCDVICEHEHLVKGGSYESLIEAQHKFDARESRLVKDPEFLRDWLWIKNHFDLTKHQSDSGVIRRRMVSERNFRPDNWNFTWRSKRDRFENVFDAFCHKWTLYGMERDRPLAPKVERQYHALRNDDCHPALLELRLQPGLKMAFHHEIAPLPRRATPGRETRRERVSASNTCCESQTLHGRGETPGNERRREGLLGDGKNRNVRFRPKATAAAFEGEVRVGRWSGNSK